MPKKRPADERGGGGRAAKESKNRRRRQLYLVLDDWELGYSIRKLDLVGRTKQRLPPAVFRLEAPHALPGLFTTWGTKIVAMHVQPRCAALMWDVSTRALTFGPRQKFEPSNYFSIYVEVKDQFFLLDCGNFLVLYPPPPPLEALKPNVEIVWKWKKLPAPPFSHFIVSHAVHPDERTIFFSSEEETRKHTTFSFDTETWQWTCHGKWRLPFNGRGYFDPELEAFVGLSDAVGHLCTCDLVPGEALDPNSRSKLSKDKLFCLDPAEKHIGATLVYTGSRSKYCFVQCLSVNERHHDMWGKFLPKSRHYLLRVTTFFLKYDRNGDLRAVVHGQVRSYRLPKGANYYKDNLENPLAFWV